MHKSGSKEFQCYLDRLCVATPAAEVTIGDKLARKGEIQYACLITVQNLIINPPFCALQEMEIYASCCLLLLLTLYQVGDSDSDASPSPSVSSEAGVCGRNSSWGYMWLNIFIVDSNKSL